MAENIRDMFRSEYPGSMNLEKTFSLMEIMDDVNQVVDTLMRYIGSYYDLDSVIILEFVENETVRCTYEWNRDGLYEMLNVEKRFVQNFESAWLINYDNPDGVWQYVNDGKDNVRTRVSMARYDILGSMLEVPMYRNDKIIGCIDFITKNKDSEIFQTSIGDMKSFARVMASYLLPMRELDDNERKIGEISEYDSISRLPKFEIFRKNVENYLDKITENKVAIISFDFSNFKFLNEKYGHSAGDHILKNVASRIYMVSGSIISCCRPFSDNFLVAIKASSETTFASIRESLDVASREFSDDLREEYFDTNIIMNVGVAFIKPGEHDLETAISNANIARKYAKMGKAVSNCRIMNYSPNMSLAENRESELLSSMNEAIIDNDFFVMLQPICVTDLSSIVAAEALVRWRKDDTHIMLPAEFLPTFEKIGYMVTLDYYVYDYVFAYQRKRLDMGAFTVPVSVNVSYVHFKTTELVDYIRKLLDTYKIDPYYVEFELSEQVYITDNSNVSTIINGLKSMGFKIFIDDFGSGCSSLNTLTKYPIDGIKLDRSFMKTRLNHTDEIILQCMINMANKLNLQIIAEGVETEEQRVFLLEHDCPYIQGHLFSKAVNVEQFDYLLDNQ